MPRKKNRGAKGATVVLDREKLLALRRDKNWTIEDTLTIAEGAFSEATYKRGERGVAISRLMAEEIAIAFHASLAELMAPAIGSGQATAAAPVAIDAAVVWYMDRSFSTWTTAANALAMAIHNMIGVEVTVDHDRLSAAFLESDRTFRDIRDDGEQSTSLRAAVQTNAIVRHQPLSPAKLADDAPWDTSTFFAALFGGSRATASAYRLMSEAAYPFLTTMLTAGISDRALAAAFDMALNVDERSTEN